MDNTQFGNEEAVINLFGAYAQTPLKFMESEDTTTVIVPPIKKPKKILRTISDVVNGNKKRTGKFFGREIQNFIPAHDKRQKIDEKTFDFIDINHKLFDLNEKFYDLNDRFSDLSDQLDNMQKLLVKNVKVSYVPKTLNAHEIEKLREWKIVSDPKIVATKLMKEFDKIQKAKQPKGCDSFGKYSMNVSENVTFLKDSVSVKGTNDHVNHDRAGEGELVFSQSFFCKDKVPYHMVCDGHGPKGEVASELVVKEFPKILAETLEEFNLKEWAKADIWNALKIACKRMDDKFEEGMYGGTTMLFTFPLMGYLWTACVGDGSTFIINGNETIPMNRSADLLNGDFARSIIKRGGNIFVRNSVLCVERLSTSGYKTEDLSGLTPRVNQQINIGRGFGNKVKVLQNSEGQKVYTSRCKIACFKLEKLEKDHLIVQCSDGATAAASMQQMSKAIKRAINKKKIEVLDNSYCNIAKYVVNKIMATQERPKDDVTVQIFNVPLN